MYSLPSLTCTVYLDKVYSKFIKENMLLDQYESLSFIFNPSIQCARGIYLSKSGMSEVFRKYLQKIFKRFSLQEIITDNHIILYRETTCSQQVTLRKPSTYHIRTNEIRSIKMQRVVNMQFHWHTGYLRGVWKMWASVIAKIFRSCCIGKVKDCSPFQETIEHTVCSVGRTLA